MQMVFFAIEKPDRQCFLDKFLFAKNNSEMLFSSLREVVIHFHNGEQDVESDDSDEGTCGVADDVAGSDAGYSSKRQCYNGNYQKHEFPFVLTVREAQAREFHLEHRNLAHHQQAEHQNESKEECGIEMG